MRRTSASCSVQTSRQLFTGAPCPWGGGSTAAGGATDLLQPKDLPDSNTEGVAYSPAGLDPGLRRKPVRACAMERFQRRVASVARKCALEKEECHRWAIQRQCVSRKVAGPTTCQDQWPAG